MVVDQDLMLPGCEDAGQLDTPGWRCCDANPGCRTSSPLPVSLWTCEPVDLPQEQTGLLLPQLKVQESNCGLAEDSGILESLR